MRMVVVRNGEARMLYDTMRNVSVVGMVQPDGSVTMLGETDINSRVTGRFENGRFRGELATVQCVRAPQRGAAPGCRARSDQKPFGEIDRMRAWCRGRAGAPCP
jgi:hypothetical protein